MKKITYDIKEFNFYELLENWFNQGPLNLIDKNIELLERKNDQSTEFHKGYYELIRTPHVQDLYTKFIKNIVYPLYNESIVYQAIPTFRIAFQNNIAVGEFHKDKNYRNIQWAEEVKEDNFFLPFTDAFDTNTIWVETEEDKGDYFPMECKLGEIIQWDGSNLTHGNKPNKTGKTRVSVDFRVIKLSNYKESDQGSINTNTKFALASYYKLME